MAERDGNVIYSPYSVAAALALASVGSKGQTFDEIKRGLHLTGDQSAIADQFSTSQTELTKNAGNVQLDVANRLYVKNGYSLNANFEEIAAKKFNSGIESVNFLENVKTAGVINQWVEQKTHDKIKDLIKADTLDGDTRVILVNAIYFKGPWKHQFNKDQTKKEKFWTGQDTSVDVDMMHVKENFKYADLNELDAVAVELPYNNSDISMLVILPKSRTGLKDLEAKLKNTNLADITGKMYTSEVEVSMPKFRCEFEASLVEPLKKVCGAHNSTSVFSSVFKWWLIYIRLQLGFTSMFANADFSNMLTSPEPLTVSDVVHKAFIDVNEEGAEAAAATGMYQILHLFVPCLLSVQFCKAWC